MNANGKAWIVAASIGAVEALKDQGICRWNYTIRLIQQHANNNIKSFTQAKMVSSSRPSTSRTGAAAMCDEARIVKMKKREASMDKVIDLNCWGPSTIRY